MGHKIWVSSLAHFSPRLSRSKTGLKCRSERLSLCALPASNKIIVATCQLLPWFGLVVWWFKSNHQLRVTHMSFMAKLQTCRVKKRVPGFRGGKRNIQLHHSLTQIQTLVRHAETLAMAEGLASLASQKATDQTGEAPYKLLSVFGIPKGNPEIHRKWTDLSEKLRPIWQNDLVKVQCWNRNARTKTLN